MKEKTIHSLAAVAVALSLMLTVMFATTGCNTLSPEQRETVRHAAKEVALIGIGLGLNQLGQSVSELRPYIPTLQASINATFAATDDPAEAADAVAAAVGDIVPAKYQEMVLTEIVSSATSPATASGDSVGPWGDRFASIIQRL